MLIDIVDQDILKEASEKHIAFYVTSSGYSDLNICYLMDWPELHKRGRRKMGTALSRRSKGKTYHALVCHDLDDELFTKVPEAVRHCLDALEVDDGERIAVWPMVSTFLLRGGYDRYTIPGSYAPLLRGLFQTRKTVIAYVK